MFFSFIRFGGTLHVDSSTEGVLASHAMVMKGEEVFFIFDLEATFFIVISYNNVLEDKSKSHDFQISPSTQWLSSSIFPCSALLGHLLSLIGNTFLSTRFPPFSSVSRSLPSTNPIFLCTKISPLFPNVLLRPSIFVAKLSSFCFPPPSKYFLVHP